jgi:hypothetical protein
MNAGTILKQFYDAVIQRDMVKLATFTDYRFRFINRDTAFADATTAQLCPVKSAIRTIASKWSMQ